MDINKNREKVNIDAINALVAENPAKVVEAAEAQYNNQLELLCEEIIRDPSAHKIIMLSGTSGSGKTTTALKLCTMLGDKIHAKTISIDNFWRHREEIPLLPNGKEDFESVNIIDIPLLSSCINSLAQGKSTKLPVFDFSISRRIDGAKELTLKENDIVIIEGIQALNNVIINELPTENVMKLYADIRQDYYFSGGKLAFSWRDLRFLRRMVRDSKFRHYPPSKTIVMWQGTIESEINNVIPFSGEADFIINTAFDYELNSLKSYALPLLQTIDDEQYAEYVNRLIENLSNLYDLEDSYIPSSSITREFTGGSIYYEDNWEV